MQAVIYISEYVTGAVPCHGCRDLPVTGLVSCRMSALRLCLQRPPRPSPPLTFSCRHLSVQYKVISEEVKTPSSSPSASVVADQDLQMDVPPVLFIRKYQKVIDTRDFLVRDELSDLEKCGRITPQSLTQKKVSIVVLLSCFLDPDLDS